MVGTRLIRWLEMRLGGRRYEEMDTEIGEKRRNRTERRGAGTTSTTHRATHTSQVKGTEQMMNQVRKKGRKRRSADDWIAIVVMMQART